MQTKDHELEASFRESLKDLAAIGERLAPLCGSANELIELAQLGARNDGQLRLLMAAYQAELDKPKQTIRRSAIVA